MAWTLGRINVLLSTSFKGDIDLKSSLENPEEILDWEILSTECVIVNVSFCVWPNKAQKAESRRAKLHDFLGAVLQFSKKTDPFCSRRGAKNQSSVTQL